MAESPTSQRRTNLIRQMARDLQKSRPISISSRVSDTASNIDNQSTTSEFNPSTSGLGSTRNMDEQSQELPQPRIDAQEYRPRPSALNADYKINTSALGRAFPNLSRSGSERDDDSSRSIEIGRGYQNRGNMDDGRSSQTLGNDSKLPLRDPTSKKEDTSLKRVLEARRRSLEKETSRASPPTVKATDFISSGSRQSSRGDTPLQEPDEENFTQFSDDRPSTVNITSQSSRFGMTTNTQGLAPGYLPRNFASSKGFLRNLTSRQSSNASGKQTQPNNATLTNTNQSTTHSHVVPDMPTISELVSGIFEDGTPMFSRTAKARATSGSTRFAPAQQGRKSRFGHYPVGEIAVPEEEEAIFVSLKLLQEKIADLEVKRSEQEARIQNLQDKNKVLEAEKVERKRMSSRDSGIGHTSGSDADDDFARKSRTTIIERTRLETTVRTLQEKLGVATKQVKTFDIAIKNLSSERDSAISQLGIAFVNMEQLKVEKEAIETENEALRAELLALRTGGHRYVSEPSTEEQGHTRGGLERAESRESAPTNRQDYTQLLDIDANPVQKAQSSKNGASTVELPKEGAKNGASRRKKTRLVLEEYSETEHSMEEVSEDVSRSQYQSKSVVQDVPIGKTRLTENDTILSATGSDRFADVRQLLETQRQKHKPQGEYSQNLKEGAASTILQDRDREKVSADVRRMLETQRQKHRPQNEYSRNFQENAVTSQQECDVETASVDVKLPRKSSMKSLKKRSKSTTQESVRSQTASRLLSTLQSSKGKVANDKQTIQSKTSAKEYHPDPSSNKQSTRHKREGAEELTSAFIVPDITMRNPGEATLKLSQSAREVFDQLAQHDGHNCSICKRVIEHGVPHEHENVTKITIPKPTPVSERLLSTEPDDDDDEPTMRPSQPPAVALATVLKGLEDELKHLKIKLSEYQALYNRHDPALSKRKRKAIFERIEKLLTSIDTKADQIYALYDVLEGQKQSGQEMDEDEVEVTLLRIGVNPHEINMRGGNITSGFESDSDSKRPASKKVKEVWDLESDDEELPWEGFDATGELTGRSTRSGSSKKRA